MDVFEGLRASRGPWALAAGFGLVAGRGLARPGIVAACMLLCFRFMTHFTNPSTLRCSALAPFPLIQRYPFPMLFGCLMLVAACSAEIGDELELVGEPEPDAEYGSFSTGHAVGSLVQVCRVSLGSGLNFRTGPGTSYSVLRVLGSGASGRVLKLSGAWEQLSVEGTTGWAHSYYLCSASVSPGTGTPGPTPGGTGQLAFTTPQNGRSYANGLWLKVSASSEIVKVRYLADGWQIGQSTDRASQFAAQYTFSQTGPRSLMAKGYDASGTQVASQSIAITVTNASTGSSGTCSGSFANPAPGYVVTSEFGACRDGCSRTHQGIDLGTPSGTSIRAADGGRVVFVGWSGGYGNIVDIDHCGSYTTRYAHLTSALVSQGQQVAKGQAIAKSGNTGVGTGPHLHFEIRVGGSWGTAKNPRQYISF